MLGRALERARAAELRGDLAQAAIHYAEAGRTDEAARVMILRGDGESDTANRLAHYVQALGTAPAGSAVHAQARRKRAALLLAMSGEAPLTAVLRADLLEAARDLESLGEPRQAATIYARVGDVEGQARALAAAGAVDELDALLLEQQGRDRLGLERRQATQHVALLEASGRRREALSAARASDDEALRARAREIERRRIAGDRIGLVVRSAAVTLVLGDEVVVGRIATISVASAAVSRRHVAVTRNGSVAVVRDLGSRNRTTLAGLTLAGEALVGSGIELRLGNEVPLTVRPSTEIAGAVTIEIAGARYVAPLGPARLGIGNWRIERGSDGWAELATDDDPPAYLGSLVVGPRTTLLAGDAFSTGRGDVPALRLEGA